MTGAGSPEKVLVIGSGPNGLAAAITAASAGHPVELLEGAATLGGGTRTAELTLPGFLHDVCSAIHPLSVASPFFSQLPLEQHGLRWVHPPVPLAHPLDDGTAVLLERGVEETADSLGVDGGAWRRLVSPFLGKWDPLLQELLAPAHIPRRPLLTAAFGCRAALSARAFADLTLEGTRGRGLFAGLSAHSFVPMETPGSAAFGLVLGLSAHAVGWPFPEGGAQRLTDALVSVLHSRGGKTATGRWVRSLEELEPARCVLLDVTPRQLLEIAGPRLAPLYRARLRRYRYGAAAFKVDWALAGPVPWRAPECARAGTVHLGGTFEDIASSEREVWMGRVPERPFVLLAQHTLFDPSRAPAGRHTAWAYCHLPNGCDVDVTDRIERQVERFAPGFRDLIIGRSVISPRRYQEYNPNLVGGDINGGVQDLWQLFARPVLSLDPYFTGIPGVWLCSSSTPPGGGVHGMCGFVAARHALAKL
ncbi:MAG TPA: NAD(P)/FAD-dependent oxidoreductase [Verrucomicrobiae bacterium]|nr:NAD(P)/FAD-dependent oxidoreductase [Verrucomicrobiae bacterium]